MAKMKLQHLMTAKVVECNPATEQKDLDKGLKFVVVVESEKEMTKTLKVPDFIKCKSMVELKAGEHTLEVEIFEIPQENAKPKTYYRILKKIEAGK